MEIVLLIIAGLLLLTLLVAGIFIFIGICQRSPCKMIREQGKCPFGEISNCRDCPYLDGNKNCRGEEDV